nr:unnamed protein product [Spirometra erinaceieuropaei]
MSSHEEQAGTKVAPAAPPTTTTTTMATSVADLSALTREEDSKLGTRTTTQQQQHSAPKEAQNGEATTAPAATGGKGDSEVTPKETPLRRSNRGKGRTLPSEKSGPDDRIQSCISGCIEYKPGDYIYYEEPDFDYYTIGLIEEIKLSRREKCSVVVKCFWRTRDIPEMAKQALLDREVVQQEAPAAATMTENAGDQAAEEWQRRRQAILSRELFVSELQYTVYSNQLRGKCHIVQLPDLRTALRTFDPAEEDSFFFVFAYNPETRRLLSTRAEIKVGPAYQVASLPRCRRPLDPALWRHSRGRPDCRALKHRLREKNGNDCCLLPPLTSTKSDEDARDDVVAPAEHPPPQQSLKGKRVSPTSVDAAAGVGDPKRPRVKAGHRHRCRRHQLSETDDECPPPPRCWETLVWLPQGLRNGLKLAQKGFDGCVPEDGQDSSGEDDRDDAVGVGEEAAEGEDGGPRALNGGGLKDRREENDEDDDFTLKTYLEAVRSLVAFCAFGGSDDDLISAENGLVLANLATTTQHAYDTLHRCGYNLANALEAIKHNPIVSDDTPQHWTVEQVRRFYHAMAVRGKDFHVIHRDFFSAAAVRQPRLTSDCSRLCGQAKPPPRLSRAKKRRGQASTANLALLDAGVGRKAPDGTDVLDGSDPSVRPLKYSASVPNSLFSLSEDVATEEEEEEEEPEDEEEEEDEEEREAKSVVTKPEAADTKPKEHVTVSAKPEADGASANDASRGQEDTKIKGETQGDEAPTKTGVVGTTEKAVSPAIFRPSREKTVKQLISFYYYWKRKSNSLLPSASAFSYSHHHHQQQHHQTNASFRGSCVETNFNTGISSRKKRPTGRGGVPSESVNNSRPDSESDDIDSSTPQRPQSVDADADGAFSDAGAANEAGSDAPTASKQRICRNCSDPISPSLSSPSSVPSSAGGNLPHSQSGSQLRFLCSVCRIHLRKYGELRPVARTGPDQPTRESDQTANQQSSEVPASAGANGNEGESDAVPVSPLPPSLPTGEPACTTVANADGSPDSVCSLCEAYSPTYAASVNTSVCCCGLASPTETSKQQQQTPAPGVLTVLKTEESEAVKESGGHSPLPPVVLKPEPHSAAAAPVPAAVGMQDVLGSENSQLEIGDNRSTLKPGAFHRLRTDPKAMEARQQTSTVRSGDSVTLVPREPDDQIPSTTTASRDLDRLTPEPVSAEEMAYLSAILRSQEVPPTACQTVVHRSKFGDLERIWDRSITLPPFTVPLTSSGDSGPVFSSPRVNSGSCARTDIVLSHRRVRRGSASPPAPKNPALSDVPLTGTVTSAPTQPPPPSTWPTIHLDDTKVIPSNYLNSDCPMELTSKAVPFKRTDFSSVAAVDSISSSAPASMAASQVPHPPSHGFPPNLTSLQQHPDYARYHQQLLEYVSRARELPPATAAAAAAAAAAEALKIKASEFASGGGGGGGLLTLEQQQMALLAAAAAAATANSGAVAGCPVSLSNPTTGQSAVLPTSGHLPSAFMCDPSPPATATPAPTSQRLTAAGGTFYPPPGVPPMGPATSKSGRGGGGGGGHHHHHHHQQQQQQYRQSTSQQQNPVLGGRSAHQRTPSGSSSIATSTSVTISGPHLSAPLGVCSGSSANLGK